MHGLFFEQIFFPLNSDVDLQEMDHSKKFLSCDTVTPFLFCKHSASIGDHFFLSIYDLGQHSSDALVTCISIKYEI